MSLILIDRDKFEKFLKQSESAFGSAAVPLIKKYLEIEASSELHEFLFDFCKFTRPLDSATTSILNIVSYQEYLKRQHDEKRELEKQILLSKSK